MCIHAHTVYNIMYVGMYNMWYMCNICWKLLGNQSCHRLSYEAVNHTSPALSPSVYMYTTHVCILCSTCLSGWCITVHAHFRLYLA